MNKLENATVMCYGKSYSLSDSGKTIKYVWRNGRYVRD